MNLKRGIFVGVLVIGATGAILAWAQPGAAPPDYHPSFGDLMTFAVQPRHIKLGISGHARNWTYAAYEASELRNAFNRTARAIPTYRQQALAEMFGSAILPSMDKLDVAIKAKNGPAFDAAYREVTMGCNNCHAGLEHAFVVIREPSASPYSDQDLVGGSVASSAKGKKP
jgi:hypothetical protein